MQATTSFCCIGATQYRKRVSTGTDELHINHGRSLAPPPFLKHCRISNTPVTVAGVERFQFLGRGSATARSFGKIAQRCQLGIRSYFSRGQVPWFEVLLMLVYSNHHTHLTSRPSLSNVSAKDFAWCYNWSCGPCDRQVAAKYKS